MCLNFSMENNEQRQHVRYPTVPLSRSWRTHICLSLWSARNRCGETGRAGGALGLATVRHPCSDQCFRRIHLSQLFRCSQCRSPRCGDVHRHRLECLPEEHRTRSTEITHVCPRCMCMPVLTQRKSPWITGTSNICK